MVSDETVVLLTYFYDQRLSKRPVIKYANTHMAFLPWDTYLVEPLRKTFPKVIVYDYLERTSEIGIAAMNREIIDLVKKERPKYVVWTSWQYDVLGTTLDQVRQEGAAVIGWFFDDEWRFDDYSRFWTPYLDYCVTNAASAVAKYRTLGSNVVYTIPNTGVATERDFSHIQYRYDVSFVGTRVYADRAFWIAELEKQGIPVRYFGKGFSNDYITFDEMLDTFFTSKINLNFSKGLVNLEPQLKGRMFQVCMAGGFLLTEYAPGTEEFFDIGKEIDCFRTPDEMAHKIEYYLSHDDERRAIAHAGWERACREYTSTRMVAKVFDQIARDTTQKPTFQSPISSPEKSKSVRRTEGRYHLEWARAYLENDGGKQPFWKQELRLARSIYPGSIELWYFVIVGIFPAWLRKLAARAWANLESGLIGYLPFKPLRRMLERLR